MRHGFIRALCEQARHDKSVMLLTGDLGNRIMEPFIEEFPDQYMNVGVAESNLVTVGAGLAKLGMKPFIYSIATFASMRPFEQIRNTISLENLNVKMVGIGGGFAYQKAGPTHHSMEDIGLMRLLPNIKIIVPTSPVHTYQATKALLKHVGPAYLRLERNPLEEPSKIAPFQWGKGQKIASGKDIAILLTGTQFENVEMVRAKLADEGVRASFYLFESVRPFDTALLKSIAQKHKLLVTVESHRTSGGFGTEVLEALSSMPQKGMPRLLRIGFRNVFSEVSAEYDVLMKWHGLTPHQITRSILKEYNAMRG